MVSVYLISYFFALFSICSIWIFEKKIFAIIFLGIAIATAYIVNIITTEALFYTLCYLLATTVYYKAKTRVSTKILLWFIIFISAFALGSNWLNGFHQWKIISDEIISKDAIPYSLNLYFDTIIASMGILIYACNPSRRVIYYKYMLVKVFPFSVVVMSMLFFGVIFFHIVKVDLKVPNFWLIWLMSNLLITCVTEETIFRLFMQGTLSRILATYKFRGVISILIPAVFHAAYYMPVPMSSYITLMAMSCCYGYVYHITKRIEASIIMHLVMNSVHFFVFTYPQLQT